MCFEIIGGLDMENFLTNSSSVSGAYIGLNTTLRNFLMLVNNNSRLISSFQKSSRVSLRSDLQSITDNNAILGDCKKLEEQKNEFVNLITTTHGINFAKSQKKFLLEIVRQFYDIQTVEFAIAKVCDELSDLIRK